jgi:hypothetical protein
MERGYRREDEVEREKREKKTGRDERMRSGGKIEGKKSSLEVYFKIVTVGYLSYRIFDQAQMSLSNGTISILDYEDLPELGYLQLNLVDKVHNVLPA